MVKEEEEKKVDTLPMASTAGDTILMPLKGGDISLMPFKLGGDTSLMPAKDGQTVPISAGGVATLPHAVGKS